MDDRVSWRISETTHRVDLPPVTVSNVSYDPSSDTYLQDEQVIQPPFNIVYNVDCVEHDRLPRVRTGAPNAPADPD
jgi:hypothetical protein